MHPVAGKVGWVVVSLALTAALAWSARAPSDGGVPRVLAGTIARVDGSEITVTVGAAERAREVSFSTGRDTVVTIAGSPATVRSLRPGMRITATVRGSMATRIAAE